MNSNVTQVGGNHYKGTSYQHWDFVLLALSGRYLEGNITKYIARWRKKNGLQDLQKARHYLDKLIESFNDGTVLPPLNRAVSAHQSPSYFCDVNGIDVAERMIIIALSDWDSREDLNRIGGMLNALIEKVQYAEEDERVTAVTGGVDDGLVRLPYEATAEMKESVSSIVSGYAAGKIWDQMRDTALFGSSPGPGYVEQDAHCSAASIRGGANPHEFVDTGMGHKVCRWCRKREG